jgi:hypothetical protein
MSVLDQLWFLLAVVLYLVFDGIPVFGKSVFCALVVRLID